MQSIIAFFMSILAILSSLFNINIGGIFGNSDPVDDPSQGVVLPAVEENETNEYFNVMYGTSSERQMLDLYLPSNGETSVPVVVFLHAGGWTMGSKDEVQSEGRKWAAKGIAAIVMNYHYINLNTNCDVLMNDITLAMQRGKDVASSLGYNLTGAIMGGGSAGAHLALLYSTKHVASAPIPIKLCYSMVGPCDLTNKAFVTGNLLGDDTVCKWLTYLTDTLVTTYTYETATVQNALALYSPITFVNANTVPIVMAYGGMDMVIPYCTAVSFDTVLTANGVDHVFVTLPNSNHDLGADPEQRAYFDAQLEEYIATYAY